LNASDNRLKNLYLKISVLVESIVLLNNIDVGVLKTGFRTQNFVDGKKFRVPVIFLTRVLFSGKYFG